MKVLYKKKKFKNYDFEVSISLKRFDYLVYQDNYSFKTVFIFEDKAKKTIFLKCETKNKQDILKLKNILENDI